MLPDQCQERTVEARQPLAHNIFMAAFEPETISQSEALKDHMSNV
jgi:hypothetical protein